VNDDEPVRWVEPGSGGPAEARALFQAGIDDLPSDEQLASLAARLGPVLDAPGATGPSVATATKVGLATLGAAGLGVLAWALASSHPAPLPAPSAAAVDLPRAPTAAVSSEGPRVPPRVPAVPEPSSPAPSRGETPPTSGRSAVAPASRPAETEAEFLERARGALGQNPSAALSLANQHRARYPSGVLAEEREVIAIEALKRLGRNAEAERRIETFSRRYPGSAYRKKLDSSGR
jgi:hypothetical protein